MKKEILLLKRLRVFAYTALAFAFGIFFASLIVNYQPVKLTALPAYKFGDIVRLNEPFYDKCDKTGLVVDFQSPNRYYVQFKCSGYNLQVWFYYYQIAEKVDELVWVKTEKLIKNFTTKTSLINKNPLSSRLRNPWAELTRLSITMKI